MSTIRATHPLSSQTRLEIAQGDLTQETLDAIVNAANQHLAHGGGVAGAILRAGGPSIQTESDAWVSQHGPVSHTEPAYTLSGKLPCRYIIHAVGPVWGSGNEEAKLAGAIRGSLQRAEALKLKSIAFPAISTGIFGFPKAQAATIILETFKDYFSKFQESQIELVRMTLWDDDMVELFIRKSAHLFS